MSEDVTNYHTMATKGTKELRQEIDADLATALDALALAEDQARSTYVAAVLLDHVNKRLYKLNVVTNALRGNPLLTDTGRRG